MVTADRARLVPPFIVGGIAFVAAWIAMLPGLAFWDTGELQVVAPVLGTGHATGFPTYTMLGWLASIVLQPFGDPAFRMNLFAGLCLAVAAGIVVDLSRAVSGSTVMGVVAGLGFALTGPVWSIGTHAETHALHLVFLALILRVLVAWEDSRSDRVLVAAAVIFAVSIGNHSLTLLLIPAVVAYVLAVDPGILRRGRLVATCLGAMAVTLVLIYAELPLRAGVFRAPLVYGRPDTWDGFWYVVLASQFQDALANPIADLGPKLAGLVDRTVASFGLLAAILPVGFAATVLRRPRYALLTGLAALFTLGFAMSYTNAEIARYYLGPTLIAWTWVAVLGGGLIDLVQAPPSFGRDGGYRRSPSITARGIVALALGAIILAPTAVDLERRHLAVDRSYDLSAQRWVQRALDRMPTGSVVVSWWSYSTPLWYAQLVEHRRPDIAIIDDRTRLDEGLGEYNDVIDANLPDHPVFVIRADPREVRFLADHYVLEYLDGADASMLTRVISKKAPGA
jgi:Protein O-mannosyl-transferase TMEM260-like